MTFNNVTNVTTVTDLAQYNWEATDGGFGTFILFVAFLVCFGSVKATTGNGKGAAAASFFVCFILGIILSLSGLSTTTEIFLALAGFIVFSILARIG
jgi:hypothetical protein